MHLPSLPRIDRNVRRMAEILTVLARYGLADSLSGLHIEWLQGKLVSFDGERLGSVSREARIRLALTELGTTFIKLGQALSTRPELIGPDLERELALLRANTPPDAPGVVCALLQAELGRPIAELFSEFDDKPFASASIGQVHGAKLLDGRPVVVKVRHKGIEETIASDLDIMAYLADFLQKHVSGFRAYQPVEIVREFRRSITKELDFASERRNLEEFARNFAGDQTVHFPTTYPDRCSRGVLTMELFVGVSVDDAAGLAKCGFNLNEIARHGANVYLEMLFRDGFYHADPHPGNLLLLSDGSIGIIDGGMTGRIDNTLRGEIERLLLGIVRKDAQEVTDVVTRLGSVPPDLDLNGLRSDLNEFILEHGNRSLRDFNLSAALNEMMEVIRRYRIVLPVGCSLLLKTLVMLEGTSRRLSPDFNLAEMIVPFEEKSLRQRFSLRSWWARVAKTYHDWDRLLETLPRDLADILRRVHSGNFEVRHEHRRLEANVNRLVEGLLTAALCVGSAGLWSHAVPPTLQGVSIPGVLGYLLSLFLGWRLFRAIGRSNDK
jgi:ubiquinone biosynthesis protein